MDSPAASSGSTTGSGTQHADVTRLVLAGAGARPLGRGSASCSPSAPHAAVLDVVLHLVVAGAATQLR